MLLLVFPAFRSRGPQNMDLFNLTAPSVSLTGAEVMPRVKEEPMAGGNGNPRLQAPHPGSKPSPLSLAPREGASMDMLANAKQQCHPKAVLGKGILVLWEPGLGHVTTAVLGLGHFCRGGSVLPGVGRVKGWETKSCGTVGTHSHTQPGSASPMIFHITCLPSVLTSVLLWLPRA